MDIIEKLVTFFRKPEDETKNETPEGPCPLCWGYQEYDKKIRVLYKDRQIDVNNHKDSYMLMQDFMVNHIDGIKLKEGELEACPSCGPEMANETKPIKRANELKPLSREHHFGLLLCWKIRQGLEKKVDLTRIKEYTEWFWHENLEPHFELEEQHLFPILGEGNENVNKAINQHNKIRQLIADASLTESHFSNLQSELNNHIRFEERILFNEIQQQATPNQLKMVEEHSNDVVNDDWHDPFWT
jgi:hypothetical protein